MVGDDKTPEQEHLEQTSKLQHTIALGRNAETALSGSVPVFRQQIQEITDSAVTQLHAGTLTPEAAYQFWSQIAAIVKLIDTLEKQVKQATKASERLGKLLAKGNSESGNFERRKDFLHT